ncbi:MAG: glycosyltransferase family 2 protein [Actinomycetota bacterium]|nr:glycosyltransferase family 2 protein [Actinomycetota bacterium]
MKVSVVLPVYNEEEAIGEVLEETISTLEGTSYDWEIIVVDDGSKDRTAEIVASFPQATLLRHPHNMGGGRARNTGIKAASGEVVVIADGDGTYPLRDIPRLVEELKDCDMVVGARKKEAGTLKFLRVPVKFLIRKLAEFISGSKIPDLNSGMRAIRRDAVSPYLRMLPPGHSWVSTITLAFLNNGHVVKYVPIDYYPRKGKSTFHPIRDTGNYIVTIFRTITWFSPLKVFVPLAFLLLLTGFGKMIADILRYNWHLAASTVVLLLGGLQVLALGLIADMIAKRSGL